MAEYILLGRTATHRPDPNHHVNAYNMLTVRDNDGIEEAYRLISPLKVYFNEAKAYQTGEKRGHGQWGVVFFAQDLRDIRIQLMNNLNVVYFYDTDMEVILPAGEFVYSEGLREYFARERRQREVVKAFKKRYGRSPGKKKTSPRRSPRRK